MPDQVIVYLAGKKYEIVFAIPSSYYPSFGIYMKYHLELYPTGLEIF